jgi:hypothetical protein
VRRLLESLDRTVCQAILDDISRNSPELASIIRQRMLLFEDIARMHDYDIGAILKNVETSQWAVALQGTSEELMQKINKNISKRAAQMLQEEIEYQSPCEQSRIENVRREIVYVMRRLENAGEITFRKSDALRPASSDETGKKILLAIAEKIGKEHFESEFGSDTICRSDEYIVVFTSRNYFSEYRIRREFSHDIDEAIQDILGAKKLYVFLESGYY